MVLFSTILLVATVPLIQALGEPRPVENLNEDQQAIVDFAISQLASFNLAECPHQVAKIENFSEQLVAGMLYKFDLVEEASPGCPEVNKEGKSCHLVVWEKVWENYKEVQWDQSTCTKP